MYIFETKVSARSDREATRGDEDRRRSGCGAIKCMVAALHR
jgi:hypothetical protein